MEAKLTGGDPKKLPLQKLILKKVRARIEELKAPAAEKKP